MLKAGVSFGKSGGKGELTGFREVLEIEQMSRGED